MLIKNITIASPFEVAREIKLHKTKKGRTTFWKLIASCLDDVSENLVREYLTEKEITVSLTLVDDSKEIIVTRNFLSGQQTINGKSLLEEGFEDELLRLLSPLQDGKNLFLDDESLAVDFPSPKKANLNFEKDLAELDYIKYQILKHSSAVSKLRIRKDLIEDSQKELNEGVFSIDLLQLRRLYTEATNNVEGIQKTFEDLVAFHNNMLVENARFITADLPELNAKILEEERIISELLEKEKQLSQRLF